MNRAHVSVLEEIDVLGDLHRLKATAKAGGEAGRTGYRTGYKN